MLTAADAPCNHSSVENASASAVSCNPRAECEEMTSHRLSSHPSTRPLKPGQCSRSSRRPGESLEIATTQSSSVADGNRKRDTVSRVHSGSLARHTHTRTHAQTHTTKQNTLYNTTHARTQQAIPSKSRQSQMQATARSHRSVRGEHRPFEWGRRVYRGIVSYPGGSAV